MPATRSRASTEQTAEVAAEEVKQVQEQDGSEIVAAPVVQSEPEAEQPVAQPESADAAAAEAPAADVPAADVAATNGSAEPVVAAVAAVAAETNGSVAAAENGSAPVSESNGVAAPDAAAVPADAAAAEAEFVPVDAKRKSEVGDGDSIPDSTEAKKQKVGDAPADEPVVDATA